MRRIQTAGFVLGSLLLAGAGYGSRKTLYAWCSDEVFFRSGRRGNKLFILTAYAIIAATITIGVASVGPVLMTALMVLPAPLGDDGRGGISRDAAAVTLVGLTGAFVGFLAALTLDLPPAICAAGVGGVGLLRRRLTAIRS